MGTNPKHKKTSQAYKTLQKNTSKKNSYKEFLDITLFLGKLIALDTDEGKIEEEVKKALKGQDNLIFSHYLYGESISAFISDIIRDYGLDLRVLRAHFKNRLLSYIKLGLMREDSTLWLIITITIEPNMFRCSTT